MDPFFSPLRDSVIQHIPVRTLIFPTASSDFFPTSRGNFPGRQSQIKVGSFKLWHQLCKHQQSNRCVVCGGLSVTS
jgi:hypothetical protein